MQLIVGVGVPGCGKSTYLRPLAAKLGLAYINPDDIREELTGSATDHTREIEVWQTAHERVRASLQKTGAVMDATYTRRRDRRELISLAKKAGADEIVAYWFKLPIETCLERNASRSRQVPPEAIKKMHNRLTLNPPSLLEGFTSIVEIEK